MRLEEDTKLDFNDILIVPQRSSLDSRANVSLERVYKFPHSKRTWTGLGIISSNMDTTGSFAMAKELSKHKMLTALHKYYSEDELVDFFINNRDIWDNVFYTIGTSEKDLSKLMSVSLRVYKHFNSNSENDKTSIEEDADALDFFPHMICLDVANAYTQNFVSHLQMIRGLFQNAIILAGNVVTGNMTEELILKGADIVKIGIGSGSVCHTRIKAGVGFPQASAIDSCSYQAHGLNGHICSDGGITCVGDIAKAFSIGADFVMVGGMFAGTDECEGEWIEKDGEKYLKFHGMSSKEAQDKWNGGLASHRASEGKEVPIKSKGSIKDIVQDIKGGISSACTYIGCSKIKDMPKCASFIKVNRQYNKIFGE